MQTNPLNNTQRLNNDPAMSTRFVRTDSASDARGFAQMMQAFASDSESSAADQIADRQDADSGQDKSADQGNPSAESSESDSASTDSASTDSESTDSSSADDSGSASDGDQQGSSNPQSDAQGAAKTDRPFEQSSDGAGAIDEQADASAAGQLASVHQPGTPNTPAGAQAVQAQEASMRLLNNQSEQAKLSIKSLVRSLTHASGADATAIAVDTRLGRVETQGSTAQAEQVPTRPAPDQPSPTPVQPAFQVGSGSNPNPQPADLLGVAATTRFDSPPPNSPPPPIGQPDQSSQQGAQIAAQRVDVAGAVSQTLSSAVPVQASRGTVNQIAGQLAGIAGAESQQAIRAIASIDAGNGGHVGNQQGDTNPGSLVERMKSSQMPNEAKRAEVLAQVQRGLASLLRSGKGEMTLKLTPGHLGEVRIRINPSGSGLGIRFETSSQEATELLSRSIKELGVNLQSKGIKLGQIQVEQSLSPNTPDPDAASRFGSESMQDSDRQAGRDRPQHRDRAEHRDTDSEDQIQSEQPESIWTEIGLDAIA